MLPFLSQAEFEKVVNIVIELSESQKLTLLEQLNRHLAAADSVAVQMNFEVLLKLLIIDCGKHENARVRQLTREVQQRLQKQRE